MKELRLRVNQIELQARDYEHPGQTIVCLHFSGANLMMWQRALPYFQENYRLVLLDLRGHGKSDKPETGYHIDDLAGDISGALEQLNIERAHIIGSSLGAEVGLSLATHAPEKVLSLACDGALYNEYGPYGVWEGSKAAYREHVTASLEKIRTAPLQTYPSVEALVDARRRALGDWWNEYVEALVRYDARPGGDGQFSLAWPKPARLAYMQNYFNCQLEQYYPWVKCPLLMLSDEEDYHSPRTSAAMQALCKLAPHGRVVMVPGWVHPYGWMLDPEAICRILLEFLAALPGG